MTVDNKQMWIEQTFTMIIKISLRHFRKEWLEVKSHRKYHIIPAPNLGRLSFKYRSVRQLF